MQQLLQGLDHCHSRGVLHRDIKGSNLLIDNNGILKIADFGLASFFDPHQSQPLTSRVVTLWYRPPELLLGATLYGTAVDLWSTGCILAELYAGKPIMPGRTEVFFFSLSFWFPTKHVEMMPFVACDLIESSWSDVHIYIIGLIHMIYCFIYLAIIKGPKNLLDQSLYLLRTSLGILLARSDHYVTISSHAVYGC
jgi:serine/threonine protein kinase